MREHDLQGSKQKIMNRPDRCDYTLREFSGSRRALTRGVRASSCLSGPQEVTITIQVDRTVTPVPSLSITQRKAGLHEHVHVCSTEHALVGTRQSAAVGFLNGESRHYTWAHSNPAQATRMRAHVPGDKHGCTFHVNTQHVWVEWDRVSVRKSLDEETAFFRLALVISSQHLIVGNKFVQIEMKITIDAFGEGTPAGLHRPWLLFSHAPRAHLPRYSREFRCQVEGIA